MVQFRQNCFFHFLWKHFYFSQFHYSSAPISVQHIHWFHRYGFLVFPPDHISLFLFFQCLPVLKHDFLLAELKKRSWVEKIYGDHAGLHVLVQVNTEKKEKEICDLAEKKESVSMESVNMLYGNRSRAVMKLWEKKCFHRKWKKQFCRNCTT